MAMGRLSNRQQARCTGSRLAVDLAPRHAFYDWCNTVLAEAEFDETVEMLCQSYYKNNVGRPSIPPGRYFRMLFVGQFEGLDSEREIAWRCADSLSLHRFLKLVEGETVPDHSTLSVTRSRLPQYFRRSTICQDAGDDESQDQIPREFPAVCSIRVAGARRRVSRAIPLGAG